MFSKRYVGAIGAMALLALGACGKSTPPAAPPKALVSGVELKNFDTSVRPQDDFYRHVNGTWLKTAQIPADRSNYGTFSKLADDSEARLKAIIEESAAKKDKAPGSDEQKVGDLYASFMDEAAIEAAGLKPLEGEFARIDGLKDKADLAGQWAHFTRISVSSPIYPYVNQDAKDATRYIAYFAQGAPYTGAVSGLGLPSRDYYLSNDAKFKEIRTQYLAHVEKTLALAGIKDPKKAAADIFALETSIAKIHWTAVDNRDDDKTYNYFEQAKLATLMPAFDWNGFITALDYGKTPGVIVMQPSYFQGLAKLIADTPLPVWQTYSKWHLLKTYSENLSKGFVDQDFGFYGNTLRGIQENRPRWKRGVAVVENSLGEVVGKIYVARHFPPEAKARMQVLVDNLKKAYRESIGQLEWMSADTKKQALAKLDKFTTKIGYPDTWKDYSALTVKADDLVGNLLRSSEVEHKRQADKLGAPIDRGEWGMTPQTVNAYYNPGLNEIVFPAAILQPPFFNLEADDAVNYGGIGAVIGHEIGHGFDDQGSKYDGDGNLKSWWTKEDRAAFEERTRMLVKQYDAFEPIKGQHVSGDLTLGENIGDLGGATIAYKAYHLSLGDKPAETMDGYTGDQRFYIGWAQVWARLYREPALLERLKTDPHSPSEYRANGPLKNLHHFAEAFDVKPGDGMYLPPEQRVKIW